MHPNSVPSETQSPTFSFSFMCICSFSLYSYESLSVYPACLAVPSQMPSAVLSSRLCVVTLVLPCCRFPIFLILSCIPWPLLLPRAGFYVLSVCLLLDQSPSRILTVPVLFLIHEYGVTHMKCVGGILSFSGELGDILHSCA